MSITIQGVSCHFGSWLCPKGYAAITLFGHAFFRLPYDKASADHHFAYIVNHERIHVMQARKDGWLVFYLKYGWYYLVNRCKGWNHRSAYRLIPYEVEAYENDHNLTYKIE